VAVPPAPQGLRQPRRPCPLLKLECGNIAFQHPFRRSPFVELRVFLNSQYNIRLQFCGVPSIEGTLRWMRIYNYAAWHECHRLAAPGKCINTLNGPRDYTIRVATAGRNAMRKRRERGGRRGSSATFL
jgi:hypothetical protein